MNGGAAPLVSVIIPAFHAQTFIADAVKSVLVQRDAPAFEILVSPDDDADYAELRQLAPPERMHLLSPNGHHGVAAARNRAIDVARGTFLALCDADDRWPETYLAELVPLARREGAAGANTHYTDWNGELFRVPPIRGPRLTLDAYARSLASIRPLWNRALGVRFQPVFAEDVLHTLHLVALIDGGLPIAARTHYQLRIWHGSATWQGVARERDIVAAYARLIEAVRTTPERLGLENLSAAPRHTIAEALEFWHFANETYLAGGGGQSFMCFVAHREAELWDTFGACRAARGGS